jgi:hypothetical protein
VRSVGCLNLISNWLRRYDRSGKLLLWSAEQVEQERERAEILAAKLRELGVDPDTLT